MLCAQCASPNTILLLILYCCVQGVETEGGRVLDSIKGDISFNAVQFAYPLRKHEPVLQSIDLHIPAGSTLVSKVFKYYKYTNILYIAAATTNTTVLTFMQTAAA
jgi:hypothetical protein